MNQYNIEDIGKLRILVVGDKQYETVYSKKIIELLIKRKGLDRAPEYFSHIKKRNYFLKPLFEYLEFEKLEGLRVLEVGCSAGQFTEFINAQPSINAIYCFDVDKTLVEVTKIKIKELRLSKVKAVDCLSIKETIELPYADSFFDLIIVASVLEHLPFEGRFLYVDEYYRKLKTGGIICFLDTPNRNYPLEKHSIGLPFINKMSAQTAFMYAKLFGKLKNVEFSAFIRSGVGWRNASYYDCLPHSLAIEVKDISEETGYGYGFFKRIPRSKKFNLLLKPVFYLLKQISDRLGFSVSFFLPNLNVVFRKEVDYEK